MLFVLQSCKGQNNPQYIGAQFGVLDLDKVTFTEQLDTLFSKAGKSYKMAKVDEVLDDQSGKAGSTLHYIYRIPASAATPGMFSFKKLAIGRNEVVDFYADQGNRFRKVEVSVYLSDKQYRELRDACKKFKDITPANVSKVHNGHYTILQGKDAATNSQTTLYCLNNEADSNNDRQKAYFIRISKISLKTTNDRFYQRFNDDIK